MHRPDEIGCPELGPQRATPRRDRTGSGRFWRATRKLALLLTLCVGTAAAEPLDLSDRRPRWVEVRFEISPDDTPGALDRVWSAPQRAWLTPRADFEEVRIRIPGPAVEAHLRSTGRDPIEGSFTDFLWRLDPRSGHVREAQVVGRVRETLRVGPMRIAAAIQISTDVTTERGGGYRYARGVLGIPTHPFCRPALGAADCVSVPPVRFDRDRGYVNAVGFVRARHALTEIETFSPLGEVEFREIRSGTETIVSGPSTGEALCSQVVDRACAIGGGDT